MALSIRSCRDVGLVRPLNMAYSRYKIWFPYRVQNKGTKHGIHDNQASLEHQLHQCIDNGDIKGMTQLGYSVNFLNQDYNINTDGWQNNCKTCYWNNDSRPIVIWCPTSGDRVFISYFL